ncbi:hypothetical protein JGH11_19130, partial [Dysgonomonas sp. Marseille-P4677]|uniref:hypothetical protein n=1 Tax=Dysgonomonas sp. Marseille-P4677 TaxID=2364790 RepID=UPI0019131DCD
YSIGVCFAAITLFSSCSGCVKKASKKLTETGLDAVEGISEAVDEHGARVGEKATDAAGKLAEGVGRSLDRQMDEHAEKVASVLGRTLVQTVEGLDKGATAQYYDPISYTPNLCTGVSLDYFGKIKSKAVIDAYFIVIHKGTYTCKFQFIGADGKVYLTKDAEIVIPEDARKYSLVSFALNPEEEKAFANNNGDVKIVVTKK